MEIRKYNPADRDDLINLWKRVFPNDPPHNAPSRVIDLKLAVDDMIFLAEEGDTLTGACIAGYDGHRGWLYAVAVSPENRRRGTGTALIRGAMEALKEIGCPKVNLQIRADNTAVAAFYQSLGFFVEERMSMGRHL